MRLTCLAIIGVLSIAGCGDDDDTAAVDAAATVDGAAADASSATRMDVTFMSTDSKMLTGYLTTSAASPSGSPGVLLIHQYLENDEQWGSLPDELAARGYRVLAFNLRGHGDSDSYDGTLSAILSDPDAAPADVDAALAYLRGAGLADPSRIAIVGTSIGANLTVAAAIGNKAKTYISLSSRLGPVETFAGATADTMTSVYYLAGENDPGNQATDAQTMHDATTAPRDIQIYLGVSDHGIAILRNQADAATKIFDWLSTNL